MFIAGQRYCSLAEPDLGLGIVTGLAGKQVTLSFATRTCTRTYMTMNAPLKRVLLNQGDSFRASDGRRCTVQSVRGNPDSQTVVYATDHGDIRESDLPDTLSGGGPSARLAAGIVDSVADFDFRVQVLDAQCSRIASSALGLVGGRVELLPYQFDIAASVSSRRHPRVLLSDETGLGKTIEACLIMHRLLACGRISRILIIVPPALVHQWFVELLRRFNCTTRIFDEAFCSEYSKDLNPFLADQIGLVSIEHIASDKKVLAAAVSAGFDLLIIDEAHHLKESSPGYAAVTALSRASRALILLSATPEHLGRHDHFLRLRLLDPDRYPDFDSFKRESDRLTELAACIDEVADTASRAGDPVIVRNSPRLAAFIASHESSRSVALSVDATEAVSVEELIDRYGTGRSVFRNTRRVVRAITTRDVVLAPLPSSQSMSRRLWVEFCADAGLGQSAETLDAADSRVEWLAELFQQYAGEKFLVVCHTQERAMRLERAVARHMTITCVLFHEELTLLQRDRNAAWFSEPEGARVLICSEIGSEGRNFQFCHNLVLLDIPLDPDVLEQRIGRLDRIGQSSAIRIFVPCVTDSVHHALARWYHEGLDAFSSHQSCSRAVFDGLGEELLSLLKAAENRSVDETAFASLLSKARALKLEMESTALAGRDRLLALSSYHPSRARELVDALELADRDATKENVFMRLCSRYGIVAEDAGDHRHALVTELLLDHRFPLPRAERPVITFDRRTALLREDVEFITIDHPMYAGALDLFISSEIGATSFGVWPDPESKELLLELVFVLECLGPPSLHSGRFLPPTPIRIVVNHAGADRTGAYGSEVLREKLVNGPIRKLMARGDIVTELVPRMLENGKALVEVRGGALRAEAIDRACRSLDAELARLEALRRKNPSVRLSEIEACATQRSSLMEHIGAARMRLDACRIVWKGGGFGG